MLELESPLPHLFVGTWIPLTGEGIRTKELYISPASEKDIHDETCNNDPHFRIAWQSNQVTYGTTLFLDRNNDLATCPNCKSGMDSETHISFWRQSSYDMVFAFLEDPPGSSLGPTTPEIFAARRKPTPPPKPESPEYKEYFNTLATKTWEIVASSGQKGMPVKRYVKVTDLSLASPPPHTPSASHLFGLYHSPTSADPNAKDWALYDLLVYSKETRSLNSVFNVRSFNLVTSPANNGPRVIATFNNKFSLPPTRLAPDSSPGHTARTLGQLMSFEADVVNSKRMRRSLSRFSEEELSRLINCFQPPKADKEKHKSSTSTYIAESVQQLVMPPEIDGTEEDDPDLGVWVGVPV